MRSTSDVFKARGRATSPTTKESVMRATKPAMKMPELLVFFRLLATGLVSAEICRSAFYLGSNVPTSLSNAPPWLKLGGVLLVICICLVYAVKRQAFITAAKLGRSFRLDLLFALALGILADWLVAPWLADAHSAIKSANPLWAPITLLVFCTILLSPILQQSLPSRKRAVPQMRFLSDEEITYQREDLLSSHKQAESFAEAVLASSSNSGLVFGVDGPWGVGKTSFINLAERHWDRASHKPIVFRFEPLRYASEPDLASRLIRDLSAAIQKNYFAPEFRPAATRYSRIIRGRADISFLGFKIALEPSNETVDELLEDIDDALKRIDQRVIIVIDDLDRLDATSVNNVLFATRRTFKLSQATYILCYDTEILTSKNEEGLRAREFLEKFVNVKTSLLVDTSNIREFLKRNWRLKSAQLSTIPSETMLKFEAVLNELANILSSELAVPYLPFVGDLRKVKRFINAMLLMQIEKSDLAHTDFNKRDLINLILLHLNYPGIFRRIYAEETDNRNGVFSVKPNYENRTFKNTDEFTTLVSESKNAEILLTQLFDVKTLEIDSRLSINESVLASRACFNQPPSRNLEKYLNLIVRFITPEPMDTFALYKNSADRVIKGEPVAKVLSSPTFNSERRDYAHDQFWRVFVNESSAATPSVINNAIDALVDLLPHYSSIKDGDLSLRQRSIYSLLRLLDCAGGSRRETSSTENVLSIAHRIFGTSPHQGKGLLEQLSSFDRGVLGWNDLMIFRLSCSMDRQGQLYNLYAALIEHQDENAPPASENHLLALMEMREISQHVFTLFKRHYISKRINFFAEVDNTPDKSFVGTEDFDKNPESTMADGTPPGANPIHNHIDVMRSNIKSFVIYQLSNSFPPSGSGVGCGYYDEQGTRDAQGISKAMNEYIFGLCFNPMIAEDNALYFLDYCLSHLSLTIFGHEGKKSYFASKTELPGGLDPRVMGSYWNQHKEPIREASRHAGGRIVPTPNYIASYDEDLDGVFTILDELADDVGAGSGEPDTNE